MNKTPAKTIARIRELAKTDKTLTDIARITGVARGVVSTYTWDLRKPSRRSATPTRQLRYCACGEIIKQNATQCQKCCMKRIATENPIAIQKNSDNTTWKTNDHMTYREYVRSGVWKCDKSPTGAHFSTLSRTDNGRCIYCGLPHVSREVEVPETIIELDLVAVPY
jgi:hypothetical protein